MALTPANGATAAWYTFVTAVDTEINGASTKLTNWWVSNTSVSGNDQNYYSFGYTYVSGLATFKTACLNDILCDYHRWHGYDGMIFGVQWKFTNYAAKPAVSQVLCIPNPVSSRAQNTPLITALVAPTTSQTAALQAPGYQGTNTLNLLHTCLGLSTSGAKSTTDNTNFLWATLNSHHPFSRIHIQGTGFPGVGGSTPLPAVSTTNPTDKHFTFAGRAAGNYALFSTTPLYTIPFYIINSPVSDAAPATAYIPLCKYIADVDVQTETGLNPLKCGAISTAQKVGFANAYLSDCGWLLGSANTGYWQNGLLYQSYLAQTPFCWGGTGIDIAQAKDALVLGTLAAGATSTSTIYAWTFIPTWMASTAHSTATKVALGKGQTTTELYSTANSVFNWKTTTAADVPLFYDSATTFASTPPSGNGIKYYYPILKPHTATDIPSVPYYAVATVYPSTKSGSTFLAASLAVAAVTASLF